MTDLSHSFPLVGGSVMLFYVRFSGERKRRGKEFFFPSSEPMKPGRGGKNAVGWWPVRNYLPGVRYRPW